jgi:CRP-like cAMP-binding protein
MAVANQASIVLVIQRSAFNELVQREPHLGMVVMKNIALELTNRLRKAQKK